MNAERILRAVDRNLDHEVPLVVYGRAALALGFDNPPEALDRALDEAVIPDIIELRDAFERAKPLVRSLAHGTRA